jgi:dethiobiotin synthase
MTTRAVFVCGAHTDVGKTHVACALLEAARARGWRAAALKPVVSGFDPDEPLQSDPGRLIAALGLEMGPATLDAMSPYRFRAALSPPMAARREGARLELAALIACSKLWLERTDVEFALVEGVGGVMSPIAEGAVLPRGDQPHPDGGRDRRGARRARQRYRHQPKRRSGRARFRRDGGGRAQLRGRDAGLRRASGCYRWLAR